jgi:hypothetical protein
MLCCGVAPGADAVNFASLLASAGTGRLLLLLLLLLLPLQCLMGSGQCDGGVAARLLPAQHAAQELLVPASVP